MKISDDSRVQLTVGAQDLEDDDRYGFIASEIQGDNMTVQEIKKSLEGFKEEDIDLGLEVLFDLGYLEITFD